MNNKGVTLVELLIVIVVLGIVSAFSIVAIGSIVENSKEKSFLNTATAMIDAARQAHTNDDPLFDDNIATMQELKDGNYLDVDDTDPWGELYDTTGSYVELGAVARIDEDVIYLSTNIVWNSSYVFRVKLISPTATIGFNSPLEEFDSSHVIYADGRNGVINGIIESITGNVTSEVNGGNDNDSVTVDSNLQGSGSINTHDGDDIVVVEGDVKSRASIDTGAGDDSITFDRLRGRSTVDAGDGDDTLVIREIRYQTVINMGAGNDTANISSVTSNYRGSLNMGEGNDTLTIRDGGNPFSGVNGTFSGGAGDDTLYLPDVDSARWAQITHLFSGFETIYLSDQTITN